MKTTSILIAALAGLAVAAPAEQATPAATPAPADRIQDLDVEFYTEREYRGEGRTFRDLENRECSEFSRFHPWTYENAS